MTKGIEVQLSPRIEHNCLKLWQDEHYKQASREAMVQVELALKEKGMVSANRFGKTLIDSLFTLGGKHQTVKLNVPLGDNLQKPAKKYFEAVFGYYRNYLAHDGSNVNKNTCLRILILASELLDLIESSALSYADLGGVEGILKSGVFESKEQLLGVLKTCDECAMPGHDAERLRERILFDHGAEDLHLDAVLELELVRYVETVFYGLSQNYYDGEEGGYTELTDLGKKFVTELEKHLNTNI